MSRLPFLNRRAGGGARASRFPPLGPDDVCAPAPNKFSAKKTPCSHGHVHDSKAEAKRCGELHLLQRGGAIEALEVQPQYWFVINGVPVIHENGRRCGYRADFAYVERGERIVEDVKGGYADAAWTLRKAIFRACFPSLTLREHP